MSLTMQSVEPSGEYRGASLMPVIVSNMLLMREIDGAAGREEGGEGLGLGPLKAMRPLRARNRISVAGAVSVSVKALILTGCEKMRKLTKKDFEALDHQLRGLQSVSHGLNSTALYPYNL